MQRMCRVVGCEGEVHARGQCRSHYRAELKEEEGRETELANLLDWVLDGEGLTTPEERRLHGEQPRINRHFKRRGRNGIDRESLAAEAVWLRAEGCSFEQIGERLNISTSTASMYVKLADPALHKSEVIQRRGGRVPGIGTKLSDEQLRDLHAIHAEHELSQGELGRRIWKQAGYSCWESAANGIRVGWLRLGLKRHPRAGCCSALNQRGKPCRRLALRDSDLCFVHDPRNRQHTIETAAKMRVHSPKCPAISASRSNAGSPSSAP